MRLFVAVEVGERERTVLASVAEACRERIEELEPGARVSWVPRNRLHVTVRFIGQTGETQAAGVTSALAPSLSTPRFDIDFDGVGVFPPAGRLRVLWVGMGRGVESLVAVEREVGRRLIVCGLLPGTGGLPSPCDAGANQGSGTASRPGAPPRSQWPGAAPDVCRRDYTV